MKDLYRVVCSENQQLYPNKTFIDIYPAGISRPENNVTHDCILSMRRIINPEVYPIVSGIILTDLGHGNIHLKYEKVYNKRLAQYQEHLRTYMDAKIIKTFIEMKQQNQNKTIDINMTNLAIYYDINATNKSTPISAKEQLLIQKKEEYQNMIQRKKQRINQNSKQPFAHAPHILLAWKQALRISD
ncbi:MAG: hypothetical protein E7017_04555 [Alphaproteobacteria bacterium]|nr:hypothetical protein [Alphaproteobacteria bacterium]